NGRAPQGPHLRQARRGQPDRRRLARAERDPLEEQPVDPLEYLKALRRRWWIVATTALLATVVGWATSAVAPVSSGTRAQARMYEATTIMLRTNANSPGFNNLQTLASLITIPDVAKRVAKDINYSGNPQDLSKQVRAFGDSQTGLFQVTADAPDP